jgi:hypothetical protein
MSFTKRHQKIVEETRREMAAQEREIDRIIRSRFNTSCMSNAKWRRAFDTLAEVTQVTGCRWKLVNSDRLCESDFPVVEEGYFEATFGIVYLKHVEWVEIIASDPESARTALDACGQFAIERTADGVRIFGYR